MIKRILDILISGIALILASPIMCVIYFLLKLIMGSPVIFSQLRPGKDGVAFSMYKFRTMRNCVDSSGELLPDSERMTRFGRFLRSSSLDELPGLWNVLLGEMSIVGPRPLLMEYMPLYSDYHIRRHLVRPGITGWAQVNGRNAIDWEEKLDLDVWYVENRSTLLDLRIILLTFKKVLMQEDISSTNHVTSSKFTGYQ